MHRAILMFLCVVVLAPAISRAQQAPETPESAEARALFDRGRALAAEQRFSEAAEAFARSLELAPRPSTHFNLGACLHALGRSALAIEPLERDLAAADRSTEADGIADAERMLALARRSIAELTLEVLPESARVTVDGTPLEGGATRTLRVSAGTHVVRAEAERHAPVLVEVVTARGEQVRRALRLESTDVPATLVVDVVGRPDAAIRVDGRDVGRGHASLELEAGPHAIRVDGHIERQIELAWNERLRLEIAAPESRGGHVVDEPAFWIGVLVTAALAGAGVAIGVLSTSGEPNGGSTGVVLQPQGGVRAR